MSALAFVAISIALGCVAASARRLVFAIAPTGLDPGALLDALRGDAGRARYPSMIRVIETTPAAAWERDLVAALGRPKEERAALVNEQLGEFDYLVGKWARVPRVCASIATSGGFLLASVGLRNDLAVASDLPVELRNFAFRAAMMNALNVISIGVAGTIFCIALQVRARSAAKARREQTDKLVDRLEALAG